MATRQVTRSGPTGGMRRVDVVLSPDRSRAYVTSTYSGNTVAVVIAGRA